MKLAEHSIHKSHREESSQSVRMATSLLFLSAVIALLITGGPNALQSDSCTTFLSMGWGQLYGVIPVNWLGAASFATLPALYLATRHHVRFRAVFGVAASIIVSSAVWFLGVQIAVFNEFCAACCGSLGLALIGVFLLLNQFIRNHGRLSMLQTAITTLCTFAFLWHGSPLAAPEKAFPLGQLASVITAVG